MDMYFFYETEIFDEKIDFQSEEIPKNLASRFKDSSNQLV